MHVNNQLEIAISTDLQGSLQQIISEHQTLAETLDYRSVESLVNGIGDSKSIFLFAAGRSGFAMRSVAMRLMHLGLRVYFVGDTTTPAIAVGDLLWVASGSGTTGGIVRAAEKAKKAGARVVAMTTNSESILAGIAHEHILIPAAEKQDHHKSISKQYAGSLFEQAVLLIGDAIFMELWKINGETPETLWQRHANME